MARIARIIAPGLPHHIVQRGNRRQKTFFSDKDYQAYLSLLAFHSKQFKLDVLSYCLMPNHVHLIAIPAEVNSLAKAIGETHRKYTRMINFRENWRGYLWQGRFSSYVLDEHYLLTAVKYILLNPVKAKIVHSPGEYKWSSAKQHLGIKADPLVSSSMLNNLVNNWKYFLQDNVNEKEINTLRLHEKTGRPLGDVSFTEKLERILGRSLRRKKPGPKKISNNNN